MFEKMDELKKTSEINETKKTKQKKAIPKKLKNQVWDICLGKENGTGPCYTCSEEIDSKSFHCGHIIAEKHGGQTILSNLKPICALCNQSMGTQNMETFKNEYFSLTTQNKNTQNKNAQNQNSKTTQNKQKFVETINKNTFNLEQNDICEYVKFLEGNKFIYVIQENNYKLYCFDGKLWRQDSALLKKYLSHDLYDFLKEILCNLYHNDKSIDQMKLKINKLKSAGFKRNVIETYKEVGEKRYVKFDINSNLLGFENIVYDLSKGEFREYKYDDYISTTTGYNWREPTQDEIDTLIKLIEQIMPNKEERDLYLQILCTTLDGKCVEKLIIFNGEGRNGKGMMNDLLLCALGNYGLIGNNSILFETNKTGSNPEKANIHKKRLVIFREPPEKNKFSNSIVKELIGGGMFSARGHYEKETQKELNLTMIVECNKKPLFAKEPTNAEARRIIEVNFQSTFITNKDIIDPQKHVFFADIFYKETVFQEKHKFALIHILLNEYKKYKQNGFVLTMPQSVAERTQTYLELSCNLVTWFKQNYEFTGNKQDICRSTELYHNLSQSDYFCQLTKHEKQKYNKSYLKNYIETNIFFRKYFVEKTSYARNFISEWKLIKHDKNECDDENN